MWRAPTLSVLRVEVLVTGPLDAGTGICRKCERVLDDHQWFEDGKPLKEPRCPEGKVVKRA